VGSSLEERAQGSRTTALTTRLHCNRKLHADLERGGLQPGATRGSLGQLSPAEPTNAPALTRSPSHTALRSSSSWLVAMTPPRRDFLFIRSANARQTPRPRTPPAPRTHHKTVLWELLRRTVCNRRAEELRRRGL
jgi:hypothetical protein